MDRKLALGASVNVLGALAKALHPLFLILATQLYGAAVVGLYLLAAALLRFLSGLIVAGYRSGIVMLGGRHADGDDTGQDEMYMAFANAVVISLAASALIIAGAYLFAAPVFRAYNPEYADEGLTTGFTIMASSLPFIAVAELAVASTRALMIMRYDAILMGFARPALLVIAAVLGYLIRPDLEGLAWAHVAAHVALAGIAVAVFGRHFVTRRLLSAVTRFRLHRELAGFAIPQSLNMSFGYFISDVDLIMLGGFGVPQASLGLYAIGAQVVRNVRQIKLAFGGAFAPLIARLHRQGRVEEIVERAGVLSRWMLILAVPVALGVIGLRQEILTLFSSDFAALEPADTSFMVALTVVPLLSCGFGLAGNVVVMTGHSKVNLANSVLVGVLNVGLNWLLIPVLGLLGAALASAAASATVTALQVLEVRWLLGTPMPLRAVSKPVLAAAMTGATFVLAWVVLDASHVTWARIGTTAAGLGLYLVLLRLLGIDPRDAAAVRRAAGREGAPDG